MPFPTMCPVLLPKT